MTSLLIPMCLVAGLELMGVGGFLPLVTLASEPDRVLSGRFGPVLFALTQSHDPHTILLRFGVMLLVLFVVKTVATALSNYFTYRVSYDVQIGLSTRLLQRLLSRRYEFFLGANSAVLLKNVTSEVLNFTGGVLIPAMILVSQALIVLTITLLLAWISPSVALLTALAIGGLCVLLFALINKRLVAWGETREQRLSDLSRVAHQAISGIKVLKATGGEELYVENYLSHGVAYARSNTRYQTAANTPTLLIELLVFGGGIGVILFYTARGMNVTTLLPTLALFGAAAYRVLPGARLIFAMAVTARYNWPSLDVVANALAANPGDAPPFADASVTPVPPLQREIALDRVSYRYPEAPQAALDRVSLSIRSGDSVAFVGSSGAGKTTATDIILGLFSPSEGRVLIDGIPLSEGNRRSWQLQLAYVPQQAFIADATLRENVALGVPAPSIDDALVEESLARASLGTFRGALPKGLETQLGESGVRLSGGERQRLAIARAFYRRPRVLLLDEATSALDAVTERQINEELTSMRQGLTLIIVAHRLSTVQSCSKLVMFSNGTVAAEGTYPELLSRSAEFAAMDRESLRRDVPGNMAETV